MVPLAVAVPLALSGLAGDLSGDYVDYCSSACIIVRMQLDRPFLVVTPTVDGDALMVLAGADIAFTAPQVQRLAGRHSVGGVRKALNRLVGQGVVVAERAGNAYIYRLNREHVLSDAVLAIASARSRLVDLVRRELQGWVVPCEFAAIFGSAARGGMRPDSDIDLLLVTRDPDVAGWADQVDTIAAALSRWAGNDGRPLEMSFDEVKGWAAGAPEPVLDDAAQHGLVVAGPGDYLRAARRLGQVSSGATT